ncbi:MAG: hypothetical protein LUH14_10350 [Clostridiaceae bacterium]|nr:hypothetical protein [Clostridiaceae bacterium]
MKIINKSRKIIGINGEALLPGATVELSDGAGNHPVIADYIKKGILADAEKTSDVAESESISDFERAKIAEEAIAQYKKEQEELLAAQAAKEDEIKEVQSMKKADLQTKAVGMGLEVNDDDTVDTLREKIIAAIG